MQCWKTRTAEQEFTLAKKCQALKKRQNPEDQLLYLDSRSQIRYEEPRSLSRSRPLPPALKEMAHKTFLPLSFFFLSSLPFFFFFFFSFPFSLFPFPPSSRAILFTLSTFSSPPPTFNGRSTLPSLPLAAASYSLHHLRLLVNPSKDFSFSPNRKTIETMSKAVEAVVSSKKPEQLSGVQLYSRFAFAGAVCCGVTHGALTPVDV